VPRVRPSCRSLARHLGRRLTRPHVRPRRREPNHLAQMIACRRRAIRAYRRLAKLAPSHYDPKVMQDEARRRAEDLRWRASWEPALEKAYGPPTPAEREAQRQADLLAGQPPPLHPNTQRAVNHHFAAYKTWKEAGKLALARYEDFQRRRPHELPSLGRVAQLMEIALDFAWIATGRDWRKPEPEPVPGPSCEEEFVAAMRRAYGDNRPSNNSPQPTCPLDQPSTINHPPTSPPQPTSPRDQPSITHQPPILNPQPTPHPRRQRRDVYASLARQQRMLASRCRSDS